MQTSINRRQLLKLSTGTVVGGLTTSVGVFSALAASETTRSANQRLGIGAIGLRYQGSVITEKAARHGNIVALCDVDRHVREQARASFGSRAAIVEDYRDLLRRKDVDVVLIGAPDHWHAKMLIDACRAGKDVYCEKPLTLTVDEGKQIISTVAETQRVVQVGSWQRSDHRFRLAVELVRAARIGTLQKVDVVLGKNVSGGPFEIRKVPNNLNWDLWQGQTPDVPYIQERSHYTFRWWYEYSGGQMTDWGAHHLDIAQWGIDECPVEIKGHADFPNVPRGYNVAVNYRAEYRYPSGVIMTVSDSGRSGVMFTGSEGRVFVNRGTVSGRPIEDLKANPLPRAQFKVYAHDNLDRPERVGKLDAIVNHMGNFFDCVHSRRQPISDVTSQHQSATTCHLGNISMRVGRPVRWDPAQEEIVGDKEASTWLRRDQRSGYEIV